MDGVRVKAFTVGGEFADQMAPASYAGAMFGSKEWEKYAHDADAGLETRFPVKAGRHVVGVSFAGDVPTLREGPLQPRQVGYPLAVNEMSEGNPSVEEVVISGPYYGDRHRARRRAVVGCSCVVRQGTADEAACAKTIITTLARRAFRRPVTDEDVDAIFPFFEVGRRDGDFESGIQIGAGAGPDRSGVLFRIRERPAECRAGHGLCRHRFGVGVPAVVLSLEQRPGRYADRHRQPWTAPATGDAVNARRSGSGDTSRTQGAGRQFCGAMAGAAQPAQHVRRSGSVQGLRRERAQCVRARNGTVS